MTGRRLRRRGERGFTLVELMVVIVILGVVAGAAVLAIPDAGGGLRTEAERFAARARAAQETAMIESRATAVRIAPDGYALARSEGGVWRETARFTWDECTSPELGRAGSNRAVFDATGIADPLELVLRRGSERALIVIDGNGVIRIRR